MYSRLGLVSQLLLNKVTACVFISVCTCVCLLQGTWKTAPPSAATVEDDGWGCSRWTMRITENVWPGYKYVVRTRAKNANGWGAWSPISFALVCMGGTTVEEARESCGGGLDNDVEEFLASLTSHAQTQPEQSGTRDANVGKSKERVGVGRAWMDGSAKASGLLDRTLDALAESSAKLEASESQERGDSQSLAAKVALALGSENVDSAEGGEAAQRERQLIAQNEIIAALGAEVEKWKTRAAKFANAKGTIFS